LFDYLEGHGYKITELGQNNLATHESHKWLNILGLTQA
jgi:hypothetical protein